MQTFLPSDDFAESARVLDSRRLGKQRVEALQIFRAITRPQYGWRNHPAVRMWRRYEEALVAYGLAICDEWVSRGHGDTVRGKLLEEWAAWSGESTVRSQEALAAAGRLPPWLGNPDFHRSHQSALLRKDRDAYAAHFPTVPDDLPYHWPAPA
ncbi:MAG TPA: MSMEG_6728 family protein [Acidimicrobiia bacterium]|jgi:hypothetical protein|nr:MSMEG_6728 family protein [Acidimicrobiia bacterium]